MSGESGMYFGIVANIILWGAVITAHLMKIERLLEKIAKARP